ncbi:CBS domain-containing protein [Nocardia sp. NBC_00508]|uniref:CBS domain-containing protein n=1 Tax=Nocardia sp. NBC_00508 TaxID=2975992 RepID=UPI002E812959|nr:CBS domain-containing protein [Nocardia sp. NBC_00508]WUD65770.1 CBS domain-containing protein [Nocardia sp. NBC_00508]
MHASQIAEDYPSVGMESDALAAARLLAEHRLPGIVVTDGDSTPRAVLPASQVVRFLVPRYVQDDPSLAGVLSESMADRIADGLRGKTVGQLLPEPKSKPIPPVAQADDTIVEVAALMARCRCPLIAVVDEGRMIGVITAARLLQVALAGR